MSAYRGNKFGLSGKLNDYVVHNRKNAKVKAHISGSKNELKTLN